MGKTRKTTYGQRHLLELIKRHELTLFCKEHVGKSFSISYALKVAHGIYEFPSIRFVCKVAEAIPPAWWFYYTDERMPKRQAEKTEWKKPVNYEKILSLEELSVWMKKNGKKTLSLETALVMRITEGRNADMKKVLDFKTFYTWMKQHGIKELSATSFVSYIDTMTSVSSRKHKIFDFRTSKNFLYLLSVDDLYDWCKSHNQKYITVNALLKGRRQLTPQRIMAMRQFLPPECWFE